MDSKKQVCGECKLFAGEDLSGNGWCEFHQKETFVENGACEDGLEKGPDFSHRKCGECDAFCECGLGGASEAKADDTACQYFNDTSLDQLRQLKQ